VEDLKDGELLLQYATPLANLSVPQ
jgi:hypothetical protein